MLKIIFWIGTLFAITTIVLISLVALELSSLATGMNINPYVYVSILVYYITILIYLFVRKNISFLHFTNLETHLLVKTAMRLKEENPFYLTILSELKKVRKHFVKEFLFDFIKIFILALIFLSFRIRYKSLENREWYVDKEKNDHVLYSDQHGSRSYLQQMKNNIKSEIKQLIKVKNLLKDTRLRKDQIIDMINNLKLKDSYGKEKIIEKILDNKFEEVITDLLSYINNLKTKLSVGASKTDFGDIEKELTNVRKQYEIKKNNKKFKINVEYLNNWHGYEDVLKKYFK